MNYNFDKSIDRLNTSSLKYDFSKERNMPNDILPMWVADMDFSTPQEVIEAIIKRTSHGIFGYSEPKEEYFNAIHNWFLNHFNWDIKSEWIVKSPGIVTAIALAVRAFTNERDKVIIQTPVYYPFYSVIEENNRVIVKNPLIYNNDNKYQIDFDDFENKIVKNKAKLFILCSPHNPIGRVWKSEELKKICDICQKYNVIVISDEIHADFTYQGYSHNIFANLNKDYMDNIVTCTAPSKTFNLAGLQISNIIISNKNLRERFKKELDKIGYSQLNTLGLVACESAYLYGDEWLSQLKLYLEENLNYIRKYLQDNLPKIKLVEPEGTYLIWLDFENLELTDKEIDNIIINECKLWFDTGKMFGDEGSGFQRINIACPRKTIIQAMDSLYKGFKNL